MIIRGKQSVAILASHGRTCPYCNHIMRVPPKQNRFINAQDFPTRDHLIPRSRLPGMGTIVVCRKCNQDKSDFTLDEWYKILVSENDERASIVKKFMLSNKDKKLKGAIPEPKISTIETITRVPIGQPRKSAIEKASSKKIKIETEIRRTIYETFCLVEVEITFGERRRMLFKIFSYENELLGKLLHIANDESEAQIFICSRLKEISDG